MNEKCQIINSIYFYDHDYDHVKSLSHVWLFATPCTVTYQASLSTGFYRQVYYSGLPFHFPGDLPDPGNKSRSPTLQANTLLSTPPGKPYISIRNLNIMFAICQMSVSTLQVLTHWIFTTTMCLCVLALSITHVEIKSELICPM